jgi:hypothetical protein
MLRNRPVTKGRSSQTTAVSIEETGWTVQGNHGQARLPLLVDAPAAGH